jgi:hypothetical protein
MSPIELLPWILAGLSLALLAGAGVLWLTRPRRAGARPLPTEWTLTARPVFNADERRVYRQLREALPHHIVLSKLPLVRFTQPTDPQEVRYWYELLGSIHVSFAICSANGRVLAAIDLDNDRANSRRALQIKQSVLAACRVRYLRCAADHLPSVPELQLLVPQTQAAARGPLAVAAAADPTTGNGTARRRERAPLWQESGFMQDSFFGVEAQGDFVASGFGTMRSGLSVRELPPEDDGGGVVVETRRPSGAPVRH